VHLGPRGGLVAVVEKNLGTGDNIIIYPGDAIKDQTKVKVRSKN
jgi:hypothetical protein